MGAVPRGVPRCSRCKTLLPWLVAAGASNFDGARFDARSIPLLVVMRDGREVDRIVGAMPAAALEARLASRLA